MTWQKAYREKLTSVEKAAQLIQSNDVIYIPFGPSAPKQLLHEVAHRYHDLVNVHVHGAMCFEPLEFLRNPNCKGHIDYHTSYMGPLEKLYSDNVDFSSFNFSHTDRLLKHRIKPTVFMVETSPPDDNGYMSLGLTGTMAGRTAFDLADRTIVQVNPRVPYIRGSRDAFLHVGDVTGICEVDNPMFNWPQPAPSEIDHKIASFILPRIHDGATVQLGIGGAPNAIGYSLEEFKDLGIHTEMLTDSLAELMDKGIANGSKKTVHKDLAIFGFGIGSDPLYEIINNNPKGAVYPISYVNNPTLIAQIDNFVSINGCLSCDLTGQVCSESIGFVQHSATGGQLDFVRGAADNETSESFLCMPSTTTLKDGTRISKITAALAPGSVVTTPRSLTQFIVTENGIADLRERSVKDRVEALINIAHADFQEQLLSDAKEVGLIR